MPVPGRALALFTTFYNSFAAFLCVCYMATSSSTQIHENRSQSIASNATSFRSLASTIRCLPEISKRMKGCRREDGSGGIPVPDALVTEAMADGLITDQHDSRSLYVSDHVIVINSSRDPVGITTFRHPLLGEWRADRSPALTSTAKNLDTAYFFFQVCSG
jgi:hypothetical protein